VNLAFGRRFARLATDAVVRRPALWRLFRGPLRRQFEQLAPQWETMRSAGHLDPVEAALETVPAPRRALDLGTGTGAAAFAVARRFPEADVVGVDLAEGMIGEARRMTPQDLADRVRFETGDASALDFEDGSFDLVTLANMIPFFDELARVLAPGGWVLFSFSAGPETPIWVAPERLRTELSRRRFTDFADFQAGAGTALLARKQDRV
jgi:ubiquinone/menaquinone biosynthesis C-methylase UbiE